MKVKCLLRDPAVAVCEFKSQCCWSVVQSPKARIRSPAVDSFFCLIIIILLCSRGRKRKQPYWFEVADLLLAKARKWWTSKTELSKDSYRPEKYELNGTNRWTIKAPFCSPGYCRPANALLDIKVSSTTPPPPSPVRTLPPFLRPRCDKSHLVVLGSCTGARLGAALSRDHGQRFAL